MKHKLLILLAALLAAISAHAYDFEVDGIYYNKLSSTDVEVTYCDQSPKTYYSGDIIIPSTVSYDGTIYSVSSIGRSAFSKCSNITSVKFPNSVTTIGYYAFLDCTSLTSVEISNSVTTIGVEAFSGCTSLTTVEIPNSIVSIDSRAFYGCTGLTTVTIPNLVISIGQDAFYNTALYNDKSNWENEVLYIGNHLIKDNIWNNRDFVIKEGTLTIAEYAFHYSSITSVEIPNSVKLIGNGAFCGSRLTTVEIPNSVTSIGFSVFERCTELTSVTIPNSVTSIGLWSFKDCIYEA